MPKATPITPTGALKSEAGRLSRQAGKAPRESRGELGQIPRRTYAGNPGRHSSRHVGNRAESRDLEVPSTGVLRTPGRALSRQAGNAPKGGMLPQRAEVSGIGAAPARAGRRRPESPGVCACSTPLK